MFAWYRQSSICYVYLGDVEVTNRLYLLADNSTATDNHSFNTWTTPSAVFKRDLAECRWLRRSWTLQELIAPSQVRIYSSDWMRLGDKHDPEWCQLLSQVTESHRGHSRRVMATRKRV
ncbi:uncharacterized protein B0I36DRAFT_331976 [Microdochium trichocladiopsis]|uniref:Heterokaryon incompatibility domain-containing protein n=1 Tax=Microdochium trichocladiopsis TaxID=1682393 RepID=A0A9P8XXP2_9PEZI|nr:uncharacterized protein B0I36DRAFT_331976 [Microdochium trichocladiopsis]KAH7024738.1 hypothetical protein B0I36DRAFT_331976 [Microdochium trichocladiopsis]